MFALLIVFAVIDLMNIPPKANLGAIVIGFGVMAIGMSFGANSGYAINPARDFGPRLASFLTGYQTAWVDQNGTPYWWLPIVAPIIGGLIGGALFKFMIEGFLPPEVEELTVSEPTVPEPRGAASDTNQNA